MKNNAYGHVGRDDFVSKEEDAKGAWMSNKGKVTAFLPWFTDDPVAEAPLKVIITLAKCKNRLLLVSKLFKSHAEEGTTKITWDGHEPTPSNLMGIMVNPVRSRDGSFKDRLPNLKSIDCQDLDTLMDLNGCPSGLEELNCNGCGLIKSLAPLAACTNLRKLHLGSTKVSNLKPLMGCVKLEWLDIAFNKVSDLSPLSACINLKIGAGGATKVIDLSPLGSLPYLEYLECSRTKVSDLNPLSKCSELKALDIRGTKVKSLAPLFQCKKLKYLCHGNLKRRNEDQTEGYIDLLKELMPGLISICDDFDSFWDSTGDDLHHEWDSY